MVSVSNRGKDNSCDRKRSSAITAVATDFDVSSKKGEPIFFGFSGFWDPTMAQSFATTVKS